MVKKKSGVAYVVGSIIIGIVAVGAIIAGLFLSGAIDARSVKLVFDSASKQVVYNGEELVCEEWTILEGELKKGHEAKVTMTGKQRDVGTSENTYSVIILDSNGADVTGDYEIECNTGVLSVTARPITLLSASATKIYDGTVLKDHGYELINGEIASSQILNCVVSGEITTAGKADNVITATVMSAKGEDVTSNYAITTVYGTLTVEKRAIALQGASASKLYDGEPLSADSYELVEGSLPDGQTIDCTVTGTITDVGEIANVITAAVLDAGGNDVSSNYEIKRLDGTLTIEKRPFTVQAASSSKIYDGQVLSANSYEILEGTIPANHTLECLVEGELLNAGTVENVVSVAIMNADGTDVSYNFDITKLNGVLNIEKRLLTVQAASETKVYDGLPLVADSYEVLAGEMPTNHTLNCEVKGEILNAGTTENVISTVITNGEGDDVSFNFDITQLNGVLRIDKCPLSIRSASETREYDGKVVKNDYYEVTDGKMPDGHTLVCEVTGERTDVGVTVNALSVSIWNGRLSDVSFNFDIHKMEGELVVLPRPITITSKSYDKVYDGLVLEGALEDCYISSEKSVVEGQTWSVTLTGSLINVGTVVNKIAGVVILDGRKDVTGNYEITYDEGDLKIEKRPLTIQGASDSKEYDGNPLTADSYEVIAGELPKNHKLSCTVTGEIIDAGRVENLVAATIENGEKQDVTYNFLLTLYNGELEVTPIPITIKSESETKVYDGEPLKGVAEKCTVSSVRQLLDGHVLKVTLMGEITEVGMTTNRIATVAIMDGSRDVTKNYLLTYDQGGLEVTSRVIKIKTGGDSKVYDGKELTNLNSEIIIGELAPNQTLSCVPYGKLTNVGTARNYCTTIIRNANGQNVTRNYSITYEYGNLVISSRPITIETPTESRPYDGKELTAPTYVITSGSIAEGQTYKCEVTGKITNAGTVSNAFTFVVYDKDGSVVTSNYTVTRKTGTLTVTQLPVFITAESYWKTYDGIELKGAIEDCIISDESKILDGHELIITLSGTLINAGVTDNVIDNVTILAGDIDVTRNYKIETTDGVLEIVKRDLTIETPTVNKEYDGEKLTAPTYTITEGSISPNQTLDINVAGEITDVGSKENAIWLTIYDAAGQNVSSNYNIKANAGTLTVTPRQITISSKDDQKVYDGIELKGNVEDCQIISEKQLVDGHTLRIRLSGTQKNVGSIINRLDSVEIVDANGEYVTRNYQIEKKEGYLTILPVSITLESKSGNKVYDGIELKIPLCELIAGELPLNHTIDCQAMGTITNVGENINTIVAVIYDGNGEPVTGNFNITKLEGTLKIVPAQLTLQANSQTKAYDGKALSNNGYECLSGELPQGHTLSVTVSGSIIDVGTVDNVITAKVFNAASEDVSNNFTCVFNSGVLRITKAVLSLSSGSDTKVYDGTPLKSSICEYDRAQVPTNHTVIAQATGEITNVGSGYNTIDVSVYNGVGKDVTGNFDFIKDEGVLSITPYAFTVRATSATKIYDGKPLTADSYQLINSLPIGHQLSATIQGTITNVGETNNVITARVLNADHDDVSYNFNIITENGKLTVTKRMLHLQAESAEQIYNGETLTAPSYNIFAGTLPTGHTIVGKVAGSITSVGVTENVISATILNSEGENVNDNFDLILTNGTLKVKQATFVIYSNEATKVYDGKELTASICNYDENQLPANHTISCRATGSIINVGHALNAIEATIYNGNGQNVTSNFQFIKSEGTLRITPQSITVRAGSASKIYNGKELRDNSHQIIGILPDNHRVSTIISGSITDVGTVANVITARVLNAADQDVSGNFAITLENGTLKVTPQVLHLQAVSYSKVYDGEALVADSYKIVSGEVPENHVISATVEGSITDVGKTDSIVSATVLNGEGKDVKDNFTFTFDQGTLTILPALLTIETVSASKEYDGTPLTAQAYNIISGNLVSGHTLDCYVNGAITNVGVVENTFAVSIYDQNGNNVIGNYVVTEELGNLEITPIPITVTTESYQRIYDGTPLTGIATDCKISSIRQLLDGHTWEVSLDKSITNVGEIKNSVADIVIKNGGENVTGNYKITYNLGTLTILPRVISIQSGDAVKDYDGTELTCDEYEIVSFNNVVDGHVLKVMITGSRTEIGESENTIADVLILENGEDVTYNYDVVKFPGSLIVKGNPNGLTSELPDDSTLEDTTEEEPFTVARVYSEHSGRAYLRLKSEGDYTGNGWKKAPEYGVLLDDTYSMNYLAGVAIEGSGVQASLMKIELLANVGYLLPYYLDNSEYYYSIQTSDTYNSGVTDFEYSMLYFPFNYQMRGAGSISTSKLGAYASAERAYRTHVYNTYRTMPELAITDYINSLIASKGWTKSTKNIINIVANYVQNAASYDLKYDRNLDKESDVVLAFLTEYKTGVCRHYASAATLLYRALGIPARYTVGFVTTTSEGEYVEVSSETAHAWVEIYLDNIGWVNVEVTPGSGAGDDSDNEKNEYSITAKSHSMMYGTGNNVLTATNEITMNENIANLIKNNGFTYEVEVDGRQEGVGKSLATITSFKLYNSVGKDVTNEYTIKKNTGTLHIYRYEASIVSGSGLKVYDGTPISNAEYTVTGIRTDLGHTLMVNVTGSQTDVGTSLNKFTVSIVDANGNDVSVEYNIKRQYGTLRVTPREIILRSNDASKAYDRENPTALTCGTWSFVGGTTLANSHKIDVRFTGQQLRIGESDNTFEVIILDENNENVTSNYAITYIYGKLTVTRPTE